MTFPLLYSTKKTGNDVSTIKQKSENAVINRQVMTCPLLNRKAKMLLLLNRPEWTPLPHNRQAMTLLLINKQATTLLLLFSQAGFCYAESKQGLYISIIK